MDNLQDTVIRPVPMQRSKPVEERLCVANDTIMGFDKGTIAMFSVLGLSMFFSAYLFREMKKLKDDVSSLSVGGSESNDDLILRVEQNSNSVQAIESKLDQLIVALGERERRAHVQHTQEQAQEQAAYEQAAYEQAYQEHIAAQQSQQVQESNHERIDMTSIPVMGGKVTIEEEDPVIKL